MKFSLPARIHHSFVIKFARIGLIVIEYVRANTLTSREMLNPTESDIILDEVFYRLDKTDGYFEFAQPVLIEVPKKGSDILLFNLLGDNCTSPKVCNITFMIRLPMFEFTVRPSLT